MIAADMPTQSRGCHTQTDTNHPTVDNQLAVFPGPPCTCDRRRRRLHPFGPPFLIWEAGGLELVLREALLGDHVPEIPSHLLAVRVLEPQPGREHPDVGPLLFRGVLPQ